jgi:hypothetical protein
MRVPLEFVEGCVLLLVFNTLPSPLLDLLVEARLAFVAAAAVAGACALSSAARLLATRICALCVPCHKRYRQHTNCIQQHEHAHLQLVDLALHALLFGWLRRVPAHTTHDRIHSR